MKSALLPRKIEPLPEIEPFPTHGSWTFLINRLNELVDRINELTRRENERFLP